MKKVRADVWVGVVVLIISLIFLFQSLTFPYVGELGPGPGFFPVWLSGILMFLSLCYILQSLRIKEENEDKVELPKGESLRNILFIFFCLILFVVLVNLLGFILSGTIFMFLLLIREYRWYSSFGISLGVSVFLFWLFGTVLNVALPVNGLGW